jgi:hypothetical protein
MPQIHPMSDPKRYEPKVNWEGTTSHDVGSVMCERKLGGFVRFSDYESLRAERDALKAKLDNADQAFHEIVDMLDGLKQTLDKLREL